MMVRLDLISARYMCVAAHFSRSSQIRPSKFEVRENGSLSAMIRAGRKSVGKVRLLSDCSCINLLMIGVTAPLYFS